ncbi:terminal protein precursor [unidentified adenovirus]|nr:terminal protein precursor [unidentified adenovirus]
MLLVYLYLTALISKWIASERQMSFFQINNYARLTNQEEDTIRFMHLTQYTDQANIPMFLKTIPGLKWCSRFFNYQIKMLENLAPQGPAVQDPPLNGLPTPHLLIGYAYLFNVNNNYRFSQRTYTRLTYEIDQGATRRPRNFWTILSDCSYSIDTSNVAMLSGPNFEANFLEIQDDIIMQRIRADIESRENIQGRGISLQPEAIENITLQESLNNHHITTLNDFISRNNFALQQRYEYETDKDLNTLTAINSVVKLIAKFLYDWKFNPNKTYIPLQENLIQALQAKYQNWQPEIDQNFSKCFVLALNALDSKFPTWIKNIKGGARLRSGTRTDLPFLRQRENQRAITENMRRNRGQIVQRFIDSLPLIRRIRRPPQIPEEEEEDAGEGPSEVREEEEEAMLGNEILRILQLVLNDLRLELSPAAREHEIFTFGTQFYNTLTRANEEGRITPEYIRRFFFYFFIMEHISSTLFYYHALLNLNVLFRRYVNFQYVQVIITGRDTSGNVNLHRVWTNNNISPFLRIFRTIIRDILTICDRHPDSIETAIEEEDLLSSLSHRPESGDPNDLINQARLNESLVHTVQIAFKIKPIGLVTTATNRQIIVNATQVRSQEMRRLRQPR